MKTPDVVETGSTKVKPSNKKGDQSEETETSKKVKPTLATEISTRSPAKVQTNSVVLPLGRGVLLKVQFFVNCRQKVVKMLKSRRNF